ncbi:hypothetical protein [Vibrio penaeicida]|uniref:hypothetical protein n=1 Tax=Vibrio penaeicida TaxID=104609 RepID=UPI000CEA68EA|nr:hypothetical protein [Vibrio penaeicida]
MKKWIFIVLQSVLLIFASGTAFANYNSNMTGVLKGVFVYTDGDYIYLTLENQPKSHPTCKPNYFVIPDTVPSDRRQMLLSRLLTAYASKETVNIGFDARGDCAHGYIRVHRVG